MKHERRMERRRERAQRRTEKARRKEHEKKVEKADTELSQHTFEEYHCCQHFCGLDNLF